MAGVKNTFIKSKMNKDLDDRLIPNGEYRDAQNAQISKSEGADVGALENVLGNIPLSQSIIASIQPITTGGLQTHFNHPTLESLTPVLQGLEIIGLFFDEVNNRVFCFLTNFMDSSIDVPEESFSRPKDPGPTPFATTLQDKSTCIVSVFNLRTKELVQLVNSKFLNFSKNSPILNVNIIEDLLFWTDNRNQPRRININRAIEEPFIQGVSTGFYNSEDHWSVSSYMPWQPIQLHDTTNSGIAQCSMRDRTTEFYPQNIGRVAPGPANPTYDANWGGDSSYLEDRFVRFSYRFKYIDNEYSLMAPFTQVAFIPKQDGFFMARTNPATGDLIATDETLTYRSSVVSFMENKVDEVSLQIPLPTLRSELYDQYKVEQIEILFKESDSLAVKVVEEIPISPNDLGGTVLVYNYESTKPIRTLPEIDTTRVSDRVPVVALAQETTGNRVLYGNYVKNLPYPEALAFRVNVSEKFGTSATDFQRVEYPNHSVKQNRSYEVGIVLYDRYGRASNVISNRPEDNLGTVTEGGLEFSGSTIYHPYTDWTANDVLDWTGDSIKVLFTEPITLAGLPNDGIYDALTNPLGWYTYRVVVKQKQQDYYNVYLPGMLKGYPTYNTSSITQTLGGVTTDAGVTSHIVLINDNINKVPRDLQEIGPTQTIFGSKTRLFARVENVAIPKTANLPPAANEEAHNRTFLPSRTGDQVVSIGTMKDLELGNAAVYFPSTPRTDADNTTGAAAQPTSAYIYVRQFLPDIQDGMEISTPQDTTILDPVDGPFYIQEYQENPDYNPGTTTGNYVVKCRARFKIFNRGSIVDGTILGLATITIPIGTVFTVSNGTFYSSSSNPLIARISTEKPLGSDIFTTVAVNPFFSLYETAPFESQLDLYYETTTTGLISDLNTAIISSGKPKGVTEWDFTLNEGQGNGDPATNIFYFTNQLNQPINPASPPVMTVSAAGVNRSSEFTLINLGPDPDPLIFPGIDRYQVITTVSSYFYYGRAAAVQGREDYTFRFELTAGGFITVFDYRGTLGNVSPQGNLVLNPSVPSSNQVGTFTATTNGSADVNRDELEFLIELESQIEVSTSAAVNYFILQQVNTGGNIANILINPNDRPPVGTYSLTVRLTDALGEGISRVYAGVINITEAALTGSVTTLGTVTLGNAEINPLITTFEFKGSQLAINGDFTGMNGAPFNLTPKILFPNQATAPNSQINYPLSYFSTFAPIPLRTNNPAAGLVETSTLYRGVKRYTGGWGDDIDNNVDGSGNESWKYVSFNQVKFQNDIIYKAGNAVIDGQAVLKITYDLDNLATELNAFSNIIIQTQNSTGQWEELLDINGQPFRGRIYDTAGSFAQYNYDTILLQRTPPEINSQLRYSNMDVIEPSGTFADTGYYTTINDPSLASWFSFDPDDGANVGRPSGSPSPGNGIIALRNYTPTGVNMEVSVPFVVSGPINSIRVVTTNHRFGGQKWNGASNSEGGADWTNPPAGTTGKSTVVLDVEDYNDPANEWYEYWLKEVPYPQFNSACVSALTPAQSTSGTDWINLGAYTQVYARSRFYKYVDQFYERTGSSPADYVYTPITTSPNNYYAYSGPLNVDPAPVDAGKPTFYGGEKAFGAWNTGAPSGIRPVWAFKFNNVGGRASGFDGIPKPYSYKDNFDINSAGIMRWYVPVTTTPGSTRDGECENP